MFLDRPYLSPVVVCSPVYDEVFTNFVARVRHVTSTSFEVRAQQANERGSSLVGAGIECVVMEEGVHTTDSGVVAEAVVVDSPVAGSKATGYTGQVAVYGGTYASPVVIGQVMSANDPGFQVFFAAGRFRTEPPRPGSLIVGRHSGEDPVAREFDEVLGYMVFESGTDAIGGTAFHAEQTSAVVPAVSTGAAFEYSPTELGLDGPVGAVVSQTGLTGGDGCWPSSEFGGGPSSPALVRLGVDEDVIADPETGHALESVAFVLVQRDLALISRRLESVGQVGAGDEDLDAAYADEESAPHHSRKLRGSRS